MTIYRVFVKQDYHYTYEYTALIIIIHHQHQQNTAQTKTRERTTTIIIIIVQKITWPEETRESIYTIIYCVFYYYIEMVCVDIVCEKK